MSLRWHCLAIVLWLGTTSLQAQEGTPSLKAEIEATLLLAKNGQSSEAWIKQHAPNRRQAWQEAAAAGEVEGEFLVGKCYEFGAGMKQDDGQAFAWFRKAAEKGFAPAQNNLGSFYLLGRGVQKSPGDALIWHRKAAEQGFGLAQFNLGKAYLSGSGVNKNEKTAVEWFQKGADQGSAYAKNGLAICWKDGTGVKRNGENAARLFREAAEQGAVSAQHNLAYFYAHGLAGFPRDYEQCAFWARKAADQGDGGSQLRLGSLYFKGLGVNKDDGQAVEWFEKASRQGAPAAKNLLQWVRGDRSAPPPPIQPGDPVYRKAARSIVWVVVDAGTGTGALIDARKKLILTAWHNVREQNEATVCFPQYDKAGQLVADREKYRELEVIIGISGTVVAKDPGRDLAIIQLPSDAVLPQNTPALALAGGSPEPGTHVNLIGNPGISGGLFAYSAGHVRSVYHNHWSQKPNATEVLWFDAKLIEAEIRSAPGNSGGPLLNEKAELVGVTHGGNGHLNQPELHGMFIDVTEVRRLLDEMTNSPQAPNPGTPGSQTADSWRNDIVFPKNGQLALRYGGDVVGRMTFDARVVNDLGDWIEVRHTTGNGIPLVRKPEYLAYMGCVLKSDVVRLRDAAQHFTSRIQAHADDAAAYSMRGYAHQLLREDALAIQDLSEAIRLKPTAWAYAQRGTVHNRMRHADEAVADLSESIRLDPTKAIIFNNRGFAWQRKQEWDKAIADYDEALRLDPLLASTYNNRGEAWHYGRKDYDKALADYGEAIRLDPKNPYTYIARGIARHTGKMDYDNAIADFDQALRLYPKSATEKLAYASISRGHVWQYGKKDFDKAIADYDETLRLNPKDGYSHAYRAMAWTQKGDWAKAFTDADAGVTVDPRNSTALALKATLLVSAPDAARRDPAAAQKLAEQAQDIAKEKEDEPWAALAAIYAERGEWNAATACQAKAVELTTPSRKDEHNRRAELYAKKMPLRLPEP